MNDDIVERLKSWANRLYPAKYGACMETAADEIERLNKELEIYKDLYAEELERNGLSR